jgi:glycosyltransferase involved in cell wall biosynthesis
MKPKVLIITYYWPPSGGSGVQRWLKFSKYLREFGWEPVIYTPENPERPALDPSLEDELPDGIEVIKTPILEPHSIYKKLAGVQSDAKLASGMASSGVQHSIIKKIGMWIRGNLFIPDARMLWIRPSIQFLKDYLKEKPVDAIVSTGPPHSMHMIAMGLREWTGIPWLADFRDPWTNIDFANELRLTSLGRARHEHLESEVLKKADTVVAVTPTMAKELSEVRGSEVHVITNGYDHQDFEGLQAEEAEKFTLLHIGTMNEARNPDVLWKSLNDLKGEVKGFSEGFRLKLIGSVDGAVMSSIERYGLQDQVEVSGYIPHTQIVKEQLKASALLLLVNDAPNAYLLYQGKLFEYLASGKAIVGIGPVEGDTPRLLHELGYTHYAGFEDRISLKKSIRELFGQHQKGKLPVHDVQKAERFSRRNLCGEMAELLNELNSESA